MSQVVSMRLQDSQMERLQRVARRLGRTQSEVSAMLVEEGLRETEFAYVEFRDSPVGRQAYIKGSTLAVWEVITVARDFDLDAGKTAVHLGWQVPKVQAALNYAASFADEINFAISDNESYEFAEVSRLLPLVERFVVPDDYDIDAKDLTAVEPR